MVLNIDSIPNLMLLSSTIDYPFIKVCRGHSVPPLNSSAFNFGMNVTRGFTGLKRWVSTLVLRLSTCTGVNLYLFPVQPVAITFIHFYRHKSTTFLFELKLGFCANTVLLTNSFSLLITRYLIRIYYVPKSQITFCQASVGHRYLHRAPSVQCSLFFTFFWWC